MAQFFGVMLIVVGLLLAALCGLCTLVVAGTSLRRRAIRKATAAAAWSASRSCSAACRPCSGWA